MSLINKYLQEASSEESVCATRVAVHGGQAHAQRDHRVNSESCSQTKIEKRFFSTN